MVLRLNEQLRNTLVNQMSSSLGLLKVYPGTQPATPDTPPTGELLAYFDLTGKLAPAQGGSSSISATIETTASAAGTAGWARWERSGIIDGSVGLDGSDAEFKLSSLNMTVGAPVRLVEFSLTFPT